MKPLHGVTDKKLVNGGANYDQHENFVALSQKGEYIDAHNMQHPIDGNGEALKKIGGEEEKYPAVANACGVNNVGLPTNFTTYKCIGTAHFFEQHNNQDRIIEFWVDSENVLPPIIRIDGIIVAGSPDIPLTYPNYLQLDVNQNCVGGEIYITDYKVPPMIFNLTDLMVNSGIIADENENFICTAKYFAAYNNSLYTLELVGSNNHPIFIQLTDAPPANSITLGSAGQRVGQVQYQMRMATLLGDRSGWSESSPLIPIPARQDSGATAYPYNKTFGADVQVFSPYGVHLRYRVDNRANYEFLEIKRIRHTIGAGLDIAGEEFLLDFRIPLTAGQLEVLDLWDRGAAELPLTDEDKDESYSVINRAKAIRYYNSRLHLMNVEYAARDVQATFKEINDKKMFPVMENIGQAGHKDPYHHTYHRSLMNGEKYGWGVMFRDTNNQKTFAQQVGTDTAGNNFDNYEMPNRRVEATVETITYSTTLVTAADVNGQINSTHEVFDTGSCVGKTSPTPLFNVYTDVPPSSYQVWTPTSQADSDVTGFGKRPNELINTGAGQVAYNPFGFGVTYHALGMAMAGLDNIPSHIKSFSVVRTLPATRIVCQGIGYYSLGNPTISTQNKAQNSFWFYSPDADSDTGSIDFQTVIDSVTNGSQRYAIQLVSPLGFFSEIYSGYYDVATGLVSDAVDMVNYVRILKERGTSGVNSFNVTDTPSAAAGGVNGVGISDGTGNGYTGYGKWRRRSASGGVFPNSTGGEQEFLLTQVTRQENTASNLRSKFYRITVNTNLYEFNQVDAFINTSNFNEPAIQNWHEPMYIVNIIDTFAEVPNTNINNYVETGHYQKTEATVGITIGGTEDILLVDERPEDCFMTVNEDKVIFVTPPNGAEQVWQHVTPVNQAAVLAGIAAGTQTAVFNGVTYFISGAYQRVITAITGTAFNYYIRFSDTAPFSAPTVGSTVVVKYNTAEPIKVFGGDTTTHEAVFSPIDISWDSTGLPISVNWYLPIGFPYGAYQMYNNRPRNTISQHDEASPFTEFQAIINPATGDTYAARLRQIICMFTCQSRINLPFEFEINQPTTLSAQKYFPATHYIMRPFIWDNTLDATGNDFQDQYSISYPQEWLWWGYGGFRFKAQTNLDYGKQDLNHTIVSKPKVGFTEETEFCTRDVWSVIRPVNVIDSPSVRTFPALNFFDMSDDTGEIKLAWDDDVQDRGNNLYAITESGICLLITDKTLLFDKTGNELAAIGSSDSAVVRDQIFLSKTIGMSDEMWRGSAEGYLVVDNGIRKQALFFANKNSVYRLAQAQISDIARDANYHSRIFPVIQQIGKRFADNITGVYDTLNDAYWLQIQLVLDPDVRPNTYKTSEVFVYEEKNKKFVGTYAYGYDKYLSYQNKTYGMRKMQTFELFKGLVINGANIDCWVTDATTNKLEPSEYWYIKVGSENQPSTIEFYNTKDQYLAGQVQALIDTNINPLALKQYYGWANYVPRKNIGVNHRMEGESMVFRIRHDRPESFVINSLDLQSKLLK